MNIRRSAWPFFFLIFLALKLSAAPAVGHISYMEGSVEISRNGEIIETRSIDTGFAIQEFDSVQTGDDGFIEVEMTAPSAGSLVKVKPDTAFYFEGTPEESSSFRTTFQLLRGSLSIKVGKLMNRESYEVQTDTAVMAVRGTEFTVDMSADRAVLVSVPEGRVESRTDMRTVIAEPGTVALVDERSSISAVAVEPADIELYREYWNGLRQDALEINARLSIQQHARLWDQQHARLKSAMSELAGHNDIFRKWANVVRSNSILPSAGEAIRDKRSLSKGMLELRASLPVAERSFQALVGLEQAWRDGFAEGSFNSSDYRSADDFYRSFQRDKAEMRQMLSAARWMIRIYRVVDQASGASMGSDGPSLMGSGPSL